MPPHLLPHGPGTHGVQGVAPVSVQMAQAVPGNLALPVAMSGMSDRVSNHSAKH